MSYNIKMQWISSLEKVFPVKELTLNGMDSASALRGEVYSMQLAYCANTVLDPLQIEVDSPLRDFISVRQTVAMPAEYFGESRDEYTPECLPGLYPDLLTDHTTFRSMCAVWHSLWITVRIPGDFPAGKVPVKLNICHRKNRWPDRDLDVESPVFTLNVLPEVLPEHNMKVTEWFHADCLCDYYNIEPWSEEFFAVLKNYLINMRSHGINMLYTPLVTPPLDTLQGLERPTFQSVDITLDEQGKWSFDFSNLKKFIMLAEQCDMKYIEFSHLFSQWGAEFAPKVMVRKSQEHAAEKYFHWHTASDSAEYRDFLKALLTALNSFLHEHNWFDRSYFHISDEPNTNSLERYKGFAEIFHECLKGGKFIDALSHPEFFSSGAVQIPIPAINHFDEFKDFDVPECWTYYCVSQWDKVTNQFAHFPAARCRIFGVLAYRYGIEGFLHWGYNFWFGQLSTFKIDPYRDICSGRGFPPGDAFKVYPGKGGKPEDSIRHEVFFEALQDLAALQLLEKKLSRSKVLDIIATACGGSLPTMTEYPRTAGWLLDFRQQINSLIAE